MKTQLGFFGISLLTTPVLAQSLSTVIDPSTLPTSLWGMVEKWGLPGFCLVMLYAIQTMASNRHNTQIDNILARNATQVDALIKQIKEAYDQNQANANALINKMMIRLGKDEKL